MAFGEDFLKAFFGNDYLKDYRHAAKTFRTNGYQNSPRFKFLFHVYFNLNTTDIPPLRQIFVGSDSSTVGLLVKTIDLPRYQLDVDVMNQYNRKRLIQKRIQYQPVTVKFHDDGGDLIRNMWYNYFSYYYKDPSQKYQVITNTNGSSGNSQVQSAGFSYNARDIYSYQRQVGDWGYVGESYSDGTNTAGGKPAFFRDITIFGFDQHKWVSYVLINPMITDWDHDTYDYSQSDGVMENSMTINYETVKYYSGAIGGARPDTNATGFGDPATYDEDPSPLSRPGGTRSVLGQGGLIDAGVGIIGDLQSGSVGGLIGAVQKAGTAYNTVGSTAIGSIVTEEVFGAAQGVLRNTTGGANTSGAVGTSIQQVLQAPVFPTPPK